MKLFGSYTSPFVRHCRVALAQSGFDFEFVEVDYDTSEAESPTSKVPYFSDGGVVLTDSSSIIKYVREKAGQSFLAEQQDYELFAISSTLLDASINVFLLHNDGFSEQQIPYVGRQKRRIESGLKEINSRFDPAAGISNDSSLRCVCFLDWALFRERFTLDGLDNLQALLASANEHDVFSSTAPPR